MVEYKVELKGKEYYVTCVRSGVVFYLDEEGVERYVEHKDCTLSELPVANYYVLSVRNIASGVNFMDGGQAFASYLMASHFVTKSYKGKYKLTILRVPISMDERVEVLEPL